MKNLLKAFFLLISLVGTVVLLGAFAALLPWVFFPLAAVLIVWLFKVDLDKIDKLQKKA